MNRQVRELQITRVGEVMTTQLVTLGPEQDLTFAHGMMLWSNVRHLPVVRDGRLVGIVSDRDLLAKLARMATDPDPTAVVADIMAQPVETAAPGDDLGEAAARMALKRIDCLPVVDGDALVGIVTTTDVLAERGRLFFKSGKLAVPSVATLMRTRVKHIGEDEDLLDAIALMVERDVRHLPVVDGDGRVVGMLSDRDVRAAVGDPIEALRGGGEGPSGRRVGDVMRLNPAILHRDAPIADLASYLLDERIGAVPIVDDDERLVGIASYVDLLSYVVATSDRPRPTGFAR